MAMGAGRGMLAALLVINFLATCVELGIASWAINRYINQIGSVPSPVGGPGGFAAIGGNPVTPIFVTVALISGVVGAASVFAALHHVQVWRWESLATAQATNLIDLMLSLLTLGLASKEISYGRRDRRLRCLEAFVIILAGLRLLQVLLVHSGMYGDKFGPRFKETAPGAGPVEPQKGGGGAATV